MEKPVLSRMQRAWLQEIGIDARMLAHYCAAPFAEAAADDVAGAAEVPSAAAASNLPQPSRPARARTDTSGMSAKSVPGAAAPGGLVPIADVLRQSPPADRTASAPMAGATVPSTVHDGITLQGLRDQAAQCVACGLHEVRGQSVFGEGAEDAPRWMFIGEAPGEYDDSTGRPFQGRAGELLQAMLASVGIDAATAAYFTNVLKCRPMGNRSPQADEITACMPLLRRQITLLRPACLVALGRVAAATLLGGDEDLDVLRGRIHAFVDEDGRSIPVVVTHHPASLLLHARLKADAWRDLNVLRAVAG